MRAVVNKPAIFPSATAARLTAEEFLQLCEAGAFDDDEGRVELVNGEVERMPPPKSVHSLLQTQVIVKLSRVIEQLGLDWKLTGEVGVPIDRGTVLGCDVGVIRPATPKDHWIQPSEIVLVVEIASSTQTRDLGMKRRKYGEAGVSVYWVVDAKKQVTFVFARPTDGEYEDQPPITFGQPLPVPGTDATITLD